MPEEWGYVVETWTPTDQRPAGLVIHLQDLHVHPEAQANLSQLIGHLHDRLGIQLVGVEGAEGFCETQLYASLPDPPSTERIARLFRQEGLLTGAEYYAITHPEAVTLWGIEDEALYLNHLSTYQEGAAQRAQAEATIGKLREMLQPLTKRWYPRALQRLSALRDTYEEGEPDAFAAYLKELARLARLATPVAPVGPPAEVGGPIRPDGRFAPAWLRSLGARGSLVLDATRQGHHARSPLATPASRSPSPRAGQRSISLSFRDYPHIRAALKAYELYPRLNMRQVEEERRNLLTALWPLATADDHQRLTTFADRASTSPVAAMRYHAALLGLARARGLLADRHAYRAFRQYVRYVRLSQQLRSTALLDELRELEHVAETSHLKTEEQRTHARLLRQVELLDHLIHVKLSPRDLADYRALRASLTTETLWGELARVTSGQWSVTSEELRRLIDNLTIHERFYELAVKRDEALVANLARKMRNDGADTALLIAGGFHTPGLTAQLKARGLAYAVISPKIDGELDEASYDERLRNVIPSVEELSEKLDHFALVPPLATGTGGPSTPTTEFRVNRPGAAPDQSEQGPRLSKRAAIFLSFLTQKARELAKQGVEKLQELRPWINAHPKEAALYSLALTWESGKVILSAMGLDIPVGTGEGTLLAMGVVGGGRGGRSSPEDQDRRKFEDALADFRDLHRSTRLGRQRRITVFASRVDPAVLAQLVPTFVTNLRDPDDDVRQTAEETLTACAPRVDPTVLAQQVPTFVTNLRDSRWVVRLATLNTLHAFVPRVDPAVLTSAVAPSVTNLADVYKAAQDMLLALAGRPSLRPVLLEQGVGPREMGFEELTAWQAFWLAERLLEARIEGTFQRLSLGGRAVYVHTLVALAQGQKTLAALEATTDHARTWLTHLRRLEAVDEALGLWSVGAELHLEVPSLSAAQADAFRRAAQRLIRGVGPHHLLLFESHAPVTVEGQTVLPLDIRLLPAMPSTFRLLLTHLLADPAAFDAEPWVGAHYSVGVDLDRHLVPIVLALFFGDPAWGGRLGEGGRFEFGVADASAEDQYSFPGIQTYRGQSLNLQTGQKTDLTQSNLHLRPLRLMAEIVQGTGDASTSTLEPVNLYLSDLERVAWFAEAAAAFRTTPSSPMSQAYAQFLHRWDAWMTGLGGAPLRERVQQAEAEIVRTTGTVAHPALHTASRAIEQAMTVEARRELVALVEQSLTAFQQAQVPDENVYQALQLYRFAPTLATLAEAQADEEAGEEEEGEPPTALEQLEESYANLLEALGTSLGNPEQPSRDVSSRARLLTVLAALEPTEAVAWISSRLFATGVSADERRSLLDQLRVLNPQQAHSIEEALPRQERTARPSPGAAPMGGGVTPAPDTGTGEGPGVGAASRLEQPQRQIKEATQHLSASPPRPKEAIPLLTDAIDTLRRIVDGEPAAMDHAAAKSLLVEAQQLLTHARAADGTLLAMATLGQPGGEEEEQQQPEPVPSLALQELFDGNGIAMNAAGQQEATRHYQMAVNRLSEWINGIRGRAPQTSLEDIPTLAVIGSFSRIGETLPRLGIHPNRSVEAYNKIRFSELSKTFPSDIDLTIPYGSPRYLTRAQAQKIYDELPAVLSSLFQEYGVLIEARLEGDDLQRLSVQHIPLSKFAGTGLLDMYDRSVAARPSPQGEEVPSGSTALTTSSVEGPPAPAAPPGGAGPGAPVNRTLHLDPMPEGRESQGAEPPSTAPSPVSKRSATIRPALIALKGVRVDEAAALLREAIPRLRIPSHHEGLIIAAQFDQRGDLNALGVAFRESLSNVAFRSDEAFATHGAVAKAVDMHDRHVYISFPLDARALTSTPYVPTRVLVASNLTERAWPTRQEYLWSLALVQTMFPHDDLRRVQVLAPRPLLTPEEYRRLGHPSEDGSDGAVFYLPEVARLPESPPPAEGPPAGESITDASEEAIRAQDHTKRHP